MVKVSLQGSDGLCQRQGALTRFLVLVVVIVMIVIVVVWENVPEVGKSSHFMILSNFRPTTSFSEVPSDCLAASANAKAAWLAQGERCGCGW